MMEHSTVQPITQPTAVPDMGDSTATIDAGEVESMVLSLYQPNSPVVIADTQAKLSSLQALPQAWSLASQLLDSREDNVRFFGALTIIVKLNNESVLLGDKDARELLARLIGWYLRSLAQDSSPLVLRKLSSALATFFLHFSHVWPCYIPHLISCLGAHQAIDPDLHEKSEGRKLPLDSLNAAETRAALWVITNIVEDATKLDLNTPKNMNLYRSLIQSSRDAMDLITKGLSLSSPNADINEDAIKCFQAWIWFSQRSSSRDSQLLHTLRPVIADITSSLPAAEAYGASADLLTDILSSYPTLLSEGNYEALADILDSGWARQRYRQLIDGNFDFEIVQFGLLLLSYGESRVDMLIQRPDTRSRNLLSTLCKLLAAHGAAVAEDKIFVPTLEFWLTYAESMADCTFAEGDAELPWAPRALDVLLEAVSHAWRKTIFPPREEYARWDSSDRTAFHEVRKDVVDLLQATCALAGPQLVFRFSDLVTSTLTNSAWLELEAAVFCLGGLAESSQDDPRCDAALANVFNSPLFPLVQAHKDAIPARVRQTCVSLIERYTEYFERHSLYLPDALRLLFAVVEDRRISSSASKSILRLSSSCRHHLFEEIDSFLSEYNRLTQNQRLDCLSCERILGGVAAVIQAVPNTQIRHAAIAKIVSFVEGDCAIVKAILASDGPTNVPSIQDHHCFEQAQDESAALHFGMKALRCFASIGRGLQTPNDVPVDLENEPTKRLSTSIDHENVQQRILQGLLDIQGAFPTEGSVTDAICMVLRTGFAESEPGPFVFPPEDVAVYLTRHGPGTPRVGAFVNAATSFISSLEFQDPDRRASLLKSILLWVIGLLQQLPAPEHDPELVQNALELAGRSLAKNPLALLQLDPSDAAEFFFIFTIRVMDGREPLPKAAAAEFWTNFVGIRTDTPELDQAVTKAMDVLGPLLSRSLARNIGGNASRSDLDRLSEPLKKLVGRYPKTKQWLEAGLADPSFPSSKITLEDKSLFVKKLISLRGSGITNQVVRDFWLAARGANFAYAS